MDDVTLVGIDLGKHSFHLHGQDAKGKAVFRNKRSRKQLIEFFATFHACTVIMEACAGSHHMARKLASFGHTVKDLAISVLRPLAVLYRRPTQLALDWEGYRRPAARRL